MLKEKRKEILAIAERHGAYNIRVFGSVARGEAGPESDIDLLVSISRGHSLLEFVGLNQALEDLLGREVHLLSDNGVHPYLKRRIYAEAVSL